MTFNSLTFIFWFLPGFLAVYFLTPPKWRNWPLLLGSLVFYGWGIRSAPWMAFVLVMLMVISYGAGVVLDGRQRPGVLALALTVLFGTLLSFKYLGLFVDTTLPLPLGISFFTFQMAAYLIDVYRGDLTAIRRPMRYANAVLLFPKLISGPLAPWESLSRQLDRRRYRMQDFDLGLRDFVLGLGLKLLLADRIGGLWRQMGTIGYESLSAPLAWLGLVAYSLQLYFDFYGYSKMAVGLGRMLGFTLPENFLHPYAARSMSDFWRRWHVTLGAWFRSYVYFPLGGSRNGIAATIRNLLVVWLLTGIWHGATVNFLLWGLFLFCLLAVEKLGLGRWLERHGILCRIYMIPAILLSWMVFAIPDLGRLAVYAGRLVSHWSWTAPDFLRHLRQYGVLLAVGVVLAMPGPAQLWRKIRTSFVGTVLLLIVFWLAVYTMAAGQNDPFLYFSF